MSVVGTKVVAFPRSRRPPNTGRDAVFEMLADMLLEAVSDIARLTARIEELEARSPGRVSSGVSGVTTKEN